MRKLLVIKGKRCLFTWWRLVIKRTLSIFQDSSGLLQFVAYPVFLYLLFLAHGYAAMSQQLTNNWAAFQALIWAFPAFVLVNMFTSIFFVKKENNKQGKWVGNTFIYHERFHVLTHRVTPADNMKPFLFKVKDAEKNSMISYEIDVENASQHVEALIDFPDGSTIRLLSNMFSIQTGKSSINSRKASLRLPANRKLILVTRLKENCVPVNIRVYITSFEIQ